MLTKDLLDSLNKILLNIKETEMVVFQSEQKKFEGDLKI